MLEWLAVSLDDVFFFNLSATYYRLVLWELYSNVSSNVPLIFLLISGFLIFFNTAKTKSRRSGLIFVINIKHCIASLQPFVFGLSETVLHSPGPDLAIS